MAYFADRIPILDSNSLRAVPVSGRKAIPSHRPKRKMWAAPSPFSVFGGSGFMLSTGRKFNERREGGEAGAEREEHPFLAGLRPAAVQDLPQDKQNGG